MVQNYTIRLYLEFTLLFGMILYLFTYSLSGVIGGVLIGWVVAMMLDDTLKSSKEKQ